MKGTSKTENLLIERTAANDNRMYERRQRLCVWNVGVHWSFWSKLLISLFFLAQPVGEGWLASVIRYLWSFANQQDKRLTRVTYLNVFLENFFRGATFSHR